MAIITDAINATNSNSLKTMLIGVKNKLKKISIGATNKVICRDDPMAISKATSILSFLAIITAVECSAALPIIGINIIPTKNSLHPKDLVKGSIPFTRNSLSIAIKIVAITKIIIDLLRDQLALPSLSISVL